MLPHEQLEEALDKRRVDQRLEWAEVADAIGISARSLLDIRKGRSRGKSETARAIDEWLGWPLGSTARLLRRGAAPPVPPASESLDEGDELLAQIRARLDNTSAEQRRLILHTLRVFQGDSAPSDN